MKLNPPCPDCGAGILDGRKTYCASCTDKRREARDAAYRKAKQFAKRQLSPTVKRVMKQFESALTRKRFYGPPSTH